MMEWTARDPCVMGDWRLDEGLQACDAWHGEGFFSRRHVAEGWALTGWAWILGLVLGFGFSFCINGLSFFLYFFKNTNFHISLTKILLSFAFNFSMQYTFNSYKIK